MKDILSPNVSRIASVTVWGKRAGIRMSLAGDQDWDRAQQEMDWLIEAPPMETHHLLADMFARDLGKCWHNNGSELQEKPLYEVYGRQLPVLLTLREPGPAEGLSRDEPSGLPLTLLTEGLRPPGRQRALKNGKTVYLGELEIVDWKTHGSNEWEYRLARPEDGLRVAFRTQLPPQYLEPDSMEDNLVGQRYHVVGVIEQLLFDRLAETLEACVALFPHDEPGDELVLSAATGRRSTSAPHA